jgi:hypothetical protein
MTETLSVVHSRETGYSSLMILNTLVRHCSGLEKMAMVFLKMSENCQGITKKVHELVYYRP